MICASLLWKQIVTSHESFRLDVVSFSSSFQLRRSVQNLLHLWEEFLDVSDEDKTKISPGFSRIDAVCGFRWELVGK